MNSKERVRMAVEHKQPDYVPSSLECVETAWDKLKKHFGTEKKENVWNSLRIDLRSMYMPPYIGPALPVYKNQKGNFQNFYFFETFSSACLSNRCKKHKTSG